VLALKPVSAAIRLVVRPSLLVGGFEEPGSENLGWARGKVAVGSSGSHVSPGDPVLDYASTDGREVHAQFFSYFRQRHAPVPVEVLE
jgi:hypothetical protein